MTDATKLIDYPADVEATIGELKSAFIDVTIHAQQAFKLVALIEQQAARIAQFERILDGLPQDAIDGGWTARGISAYAKKLEQQIAALESAAKATVPEGWKLVPIKLTLSMADAYQHYWAHTENIYGAWAVMLAAAPAATDNGGGRDAERLNAIAKESWDLRSFTIPSYADDADIGWRVIAHHMAAPHERTVAEVFRDDPRAAIDAALSQKAGEQG